ncbi:MAG: ketopantoate reductase family protein, partial [Candidatus Hodarchaeales archaeon]
DFAGLLSNAGFKTRITKDYQKSVWTKFLINIPINPLGALYHLRNGDLLKHEGIIRKFENLVMETLELFDVLGIKTHFKDPLEEIKKIAQQTSQNKSSMFQDLEKGRRTEIDFLNGHVVRKGLETGVKTPVNLDVYKKIKNIEKISSRSWVA